MKKKTIEITYSDSNKPKALDGGRIGNVIDWDLVTMEEWRRNNPEVFQVLSQTIPPRISKMIITGTVGDDSTNFIKELFLNSIKNEK